MLGEVGLELLFPGLLEDELLPGLLEDGGGLLLYPGWVDGLLGVEELGVREGVVLLGGALGVGVVGVGVDVEGVVVEGEGEELWAEDGGVDAAGAAALCAWAAVAVARVMAAVRRAKRNLCMKMTSRSWGLGVCVPQVGCLVSVEVTKG